VTKLRMIITLPLLMATTACENVMQHAMRAVAPFERSEPLTGDARLGLVDLATALDPRGYRGQFRSPQFTPVTAAVALGPAAVAPAASDLDRAFAAFHITGWYGDIGSEQQRRNQVQERLIAASNFQCSVFETAINEMQSGGNLLLGLLTTGTAGAGAIFTGASTIRVLSGTAAVLSGARAEFNEDLFYKLTAGVLIKAIETKRRDLLADIRQRENLPPDKYPVEAAVADVVEYNGACSLVSALSQASEAVTVADDPGLRRLSKIFKAAGIKSPFAGSFDAIDATVIASPTGPVPFSAPIVIPSGELAKQAIAIKVAADALTGRIAALKPMLPPVKAAKVDPIAKDAAAAVSAWAAKQAALKPKADSATADYYDKLKAVQTAPTSDAANAAATVLAATNAVNTALVAEIDAAAQATLAGIAAANSALDALALNPIAP